VQRGLRARVPILPRGVRDIVDAATVAGNERTMDGVAGARDAVGDIAQLHRRAAEAMEKQEADPVARDDEAQIFVSHSRNTGMCCS
jgi:hypothetical protein